MTIQEAINSKKPFKRKEFGGWVRRNDFWLSKKDILATDWEVLICEGHNYITNYTSVASSICTQCIGTAVGTTPPIFKKEQLGKIAKELLEDHRKFYQECKDSKNQRQCTCDINTIMGKGCQCGGK